MGFYENFTSICKEKGFKPSPICQSIGLSRSAATKWKNGSKPSLAIILTLAEKLNVSVVQLLEGEEDTDLSCLHDFLLRFEQKKEDTENGVYDEKIYIVADALTDLNDSQLFDVLQYIRKIKHN